MDMAVPCIIVLGGIAGWQMGALDLVFNSRHCREIIWEHGVEVERTSVC